MNDDVYRLVHCTVQFVQCVHCSTVTGTVSQHTNLNYFVIIICSEIIELEYLQATYSSTNSLYYRLSLLDSILHLSCTKQQKNTLEPPPCLMSTWILSIWILCELCGRLLIRVEIN